MCYAQSSTLSNATAILVYASISPTVFLTKIGKTRACSMIHASFKTTLDIHGYSSELKMVIIDRKKQKNGTRGEWSPQWCIMRMEVWRMEVWESSMRSVITVSGNLGF